MKRDFLDDIAIAGQEFGEQIRVARKNAGLSQAEIAQKINTTRQTIISIEKGDNVGLHLVLSLALILDIRCFVVRNKN